MYRKDTGHIALKSICALLLGGTANLLWRTRAYRWERPGPDPFHTPSL
jgi:hypothetical protein